LAILYPLSKKNQWFSRKCHIILSIGWLFGGVLGHVAMVHTTTVPFQWNNTTYYDCRGAEMDELESKIYSTVVFVLTFALPLVSLILLKCFSSFNKSLFKLFFQIIFSNSFFKFFSQILFQNSFPKFFSQILFSNSFLKFFIQILRSYKHILMCQLEENYCAISSLIISYRLEEALKTPTERRYLYKLYVTNDFIIYMSFFR
jgi:hypothetical protein